MYATCIYAALALFWFLGTTLFHESFSNNVYVPLRAWIGPQLMEYLTASGIAAAMALLAYWGRLYAARREPLAALRWAVCLLSAMAAARLLMVTNIEIIHYLQYFVLVVLLRLAGINEPTAYLLALLGSLLDESRQYLLHPRFTGYLDWNDLLINNIGAALGLLMARDAPRQAPRLSAFLRTGALTIFGLLCAATIAGFLTGRIVSYATLPPGTQPTAFPLVDGQQVLALSLKGELLSAFWTTGPLERRFHIMGVGEGCIIVAAGAFLLWRLTRRPDPIRRKSGASGLSALLLGLFCLLPALPVHAETILACRTAAPPVVDGRPNESPWNAARRTDAFQDMVDGSSPWLRTETALLWDAQGLYVAVRMEEPRLEAFIAERDGPVYRDNDFELFIAGQDAYWELEVNARNTVYDVFWIWRDALGPEKRYGAPLWDESARRIMTLRGIGDHVHPRGERVGFIDADLPGARVAVALEGTLNENADTDRGWTVEIALPWSALEPLRDGRALPPHEGDVWRMNLSRFATRSASGEPLPPLRPAGWTLTRHGVFDSHMPEKFAEIRFVDCSNSRNR